MIDEENNRIEEPIQTQDEAEGLRQGLARRKTIPAVDLTPEMNAHIVIDEERLATWDAQVGNTND